ncbi:MAG TPA: non-canonical purine NTP pyrophosphatase [Paracoccaceae bacterium]|mgnify:FL=1|nr:non-canonical purine NTP pyrophosphatase [Paracoccaceae bacterium]
MRRFAGGRLVVATHNRGKLEELADLLRGRDVELLVAGDLGLAEPEETSESFVGNARIKAHAAAQATGLPAMADDSGLCVDGLGGAPGVRTADWAEGAGGRDFVRAMARTQAALDRAGIPEPRRARFVCTLVIAWPDGHDEVFAGAVAGRMVWPARGDQGHGYDPIFLPDGFAQTFGEMDRWVKNRISHRAAALRQVLAACFT